MKARRGKRVGSWQQASDVTARQRQEKTRLSLSRAPHCSPAKVRELLHWMLTRMAAQDHGCLTGDCPHDDQNDCVDSLLKHWTEEGQENAGGQAQ